MISLVYEDLLVEHVVGEVPRLKFILRVEVKDKAKGIPAIIFSIAGGVSVKVGGHLLKLGTCLMKGSAYIPGEGITNVDLILDMSYAKVNALQDLRRGEMELEFIISLSGVCAKLSVSSGGGYHISLLDTISGSVLSYTTTGRKTGSIHITREKWADILKQLRYGEIRIIELPLLDIPEPSLDRLKAASTDVENALEKFRNCDNTGSIDWARRAIDAITARAANRRKIRQEIEDVIIDRAPDPLKDHVKDVISRLAGLSARVYHFQSKFVKEQPSPERPYQPPTRKDAEFSIWITADIVKYLICLAH